VPAYATYIGRDPEVAARYLRAGQLVALPTETVYGLAANALDAAAVANIFAVKNRPHFDPLIVHVPATEAVERYAAAFPPAARALAGHFWPGPLTLLLPRRPIVPDLVTAGLPNVALRMPAHPLALELLRTLPFPLAAPSANPFGYISPTTAQHVYDQLHGRLPYILDGGPCPVGVESTIVGFDGGRTVIYRLGGLPLEEIESVAGPVALELHQNSNPAAPGMLASHYAPRKPLFLDQIEARLARFAGRRIGVLSFRRRHDLPAGTAQVVLTENGDLSEAAQRLFAALRALDAADIDVILADSAPEIGLGRAINDRLRRASVPPDNPAPGASPFNQC
jgi:L-threonylcarbamoyladenylate synthase